MKMAVLCSGSGTNLQAIIDSIKSGYIPAEIAIVVSDNKEAHALTRARQAGIETLTLSRKDFKSREDFDREVVKSLKKKGVGLVVLAGYMRLLSPFFINEYRDRIINIHPALLPSFKGTSAIKDALEHGAKVTGVTVHFVTEQVDCGPIILQKAVTVKEDDTQETLEKKIHRIEHKLYPEAIRLFTDGKLKIAGRKVIVKK